MYNISDILHFPASIKMNEGAARVHFFFARKCKKSEMLYITWLNVVGVIPFIMHPTQPSEARLGGVHSIFGLLYDLHI